MDRSASIKPRTLHFAITAFGLLVLAPALAPPVAAHGITYLGTVNKIMCLAPNQMMGTNFWNPAAQSDRTWILEGWIGLNGGPDTNQ